jgi:hypothetical protein
MEELYVEFRSRYLWDSDVRLLAELATGRYAGNVRIVGQNIQTLTLCFGCNIEEEKLYKSSSFTAK